MRHPRPALALLALAAALVPAALSTSSSRAAPAVRSGPTGRLTGLRAADLTTPDPGLAVRAARAVAADLPAAGDGSTTAGTVRATLDPVTGELCLTQVGITASPGTIAGLTLIDPAGAGTVLSDDTLTGCSFPGVPVVAALLASPASYTLALTSTSGGTLSAAALRPDAALQRPWLVGRRTETVVDHARGTARRGRVPASRSRVLRLTYYYPSRATAGDGADPSLEGPFPVVVFSPGYSVTPATYDRTLRAWAEAGYLVVAVLSPGSGGGLPGTPTEADLGQQPRDLSVALTAVVSHLRSASSWLGGIGDPARVAVSGHSDGGSTAAAAGLLLHYTDPRWLAVLVMAGAAFHAPAAHNRLPLLVISGQRDQYNQQSTFAKVFALGHMSRSWVQALGASHLTPFVTTGRQADDLRALEVAFLDRWLLLAPDRTLENRLATTPGLTRLVKGGF